jgi:hypothetical protein
LTRIKAGSLRLSHNCKVRKEAAMPLHLADRAAAQRPFAPPPRLPPRLARVLAYWEGLLRGSAEVPFADDFRPIDLPDLADRLVLIDVFAQPTRFRLQNVGKATNPAGLDGRFLDEVRPDAPLDFLASQCEATVEAAAPTFFRGDASRPHARLLLPLWGDGRISLLLGAIETE